MVIVQSECTHCAMPIEIEIDSDLKYSVKEKGCEPIIFVPEVNLFQLEDDSIIDSF
ncbi:MAG: hypothetical protein JRI75_07250 [Deltaproteobacteria bacterium]|nr:hypothetical protein [Deltaproteobacteria bacterium]